MQDDKASFRHDSLQDAQSIQNLLKAISKGIGAGKVTLSDENGEITLSPDGLLDFKLTAGREDGRHRITMRITWQVEEAARKKRNLKVG